LITKGTLYFLLVTLSGIAGIVSLGFALTKPKAKRIIPRNAALALGIALLVVSIYTGIDLTRKTYNKIKTTIIALKNFPETVNIETNKDTTDYVRVLKQYEPKKFKGKVPGGFYTEYGFYDWWRFPLVYPYSIYCIDVLDRGQVANDSGKTDFEQGGSVKTISNYFDRFTFDANYFIGMSASTPGSNESAGDYFIINFQSGKTEKISDRETLIKKFDEIDFSGDREFISIRKFSERF
jgi:hypothetical protein